MVNYQDLIYYFQQYGVLDFLLPFILVFTVIFAVLQKIKPFGNDGKNFHVIIAFVCGLLFVVPHVLGTYPPSYDPVVILNNALPGVSLIAIFAIMALITLVFNTEMGNTLLPIVAFGSFAFVAYIFGSSLGLWSGPYDLFSWWTADVTELLVIIAVFGGIVYFITREDSDTEKDPAKLAAAKKKADEKWEDYNKRLGNIIKRRGD